MDDKEYGDELFIYAMALIEEQEKESELGGDSNGDERNDQ